MAAATVDEYIASLSDPLAAIGAALRDRLSAGLPGAEGKMWHGHPVWMDGATPIAGFKAYGSYVTFLLWRGQAITDASDRLVGSGSAEMSSVKFSRVDDIDGAQLDGWLTQIVALS